MAFCSDSSALIVQIQHRSERDLLRIVHRHDIDFGYVVGRALRGEDLGGEPQTG